MYLESVHTQLFHILIYELNYTAQCINIQSKGQMAGYKSAEWGLVNYSAVFKTGEGLLGHQVQSPAIVGNYIISLIQNKHAPSLKCGCFPLSMHFKRQLGDLEVLFNLQPKFIHGQLY